MRNCARRFQERMRERCVRLGIWNWPVSVGPVSEPNILNLHIQQKANRPLQIRVQTWVQLDLIKIANCSLQCEIHAQISVCAQLAPTTPIIVFGIFHQSESMSDLPEAGDLFFKQSRSHIDNRRKKSASQIDAP